VCVVRIILCFCTNFVLLVHARIFGAQKISTNFETYMKLICFIMRGRSIYSAGERAVVVSLNKNEVCKKQKNLVLLLASSGTLRTRTGWPRARHRQASGPIDPSSSRSLRLPPALQESQVGRWSPQRGEESA